MGVVLEWPLKMLMIGSHSLLAYIALDYFHRLQQMERCVAGWGGGSNS